MELHTLYSEVQRKRKDYWRMNEDELEKLADVDLDLQSDELAEVIVEQINKLTKEQD